MRGGVKRGDSGKSRKTKKMEGGTTTFASRYKDKGKVGHAEKNPQGLLNRKVNASPNYDTSQGGRGYLEKKTGGKR